MANAVVEIGAWALGRRRRFRITGQSMAPALGAGCFILVDPTRRARPGDIVVATHPSKGIDICKRVSSVTSDGGLMLASDNQAVGQDSRHFGPVRPEVIGGVLTLVL